MRGLVHRERGEERMLDFSSFLCLFPLLADRLHFSALQFYPQQIPLVFVFLSFLSLHLLLFLSLLLSHYISILIKSSEHAL